MSKIFVTVLAISILASVSAFAAGNHATKAAPDFKALDVDANGSVSQSEFTAGGELTTETFTKLDQNSDGMLSKTELEIAANADDMSGKSGTESKNSK